MSDGSLIRPRLTILTPDFIQEIHKGSLKVLQKTGVLVESERARNVFAKAGNSIHINDLRVTFEADIVEWAIKAAPSTYDVYNRSGEKVFTLGDGDARFGNGVTNLFYQDPTTDALHQFSRKYMETGVR